MRRIVAVGAAAGFVGALLGGAIALQFSGAAGQPVVRAARPLPHYQSPEELQRLRSHVQELRAEIRALRIAAASSASAKPTQPCVQSPNATDTVDPGAVTPPAQFTTTSEVAELFATAHAHDRAERGTTMRYEDEVTDFFDAHGPEDVVLDEVACGATLCRIRVEHASDEARQWFSDALGEERFGGGSFVQATEDGLASVAYVGRKGAEFRVPTAPHSR